MVSVAQVRVQGLGGQGVAVAMSPAVGPIETMVSVAQVQVPGLGGHGVAVATSLAVGPIETLALAAQDLKCRLQARVARALP